MWRESRRKRQGDGQTGRCYRTPNERNDCLFTSIFHLSVFAVFSMHSSGVCVCVCVCKGKGGVRERKGVRGERAICSTNYGYLLEATTRGAVHRMICCCSWVWEVLSVGVLLREYRLSAHWQLHRPYRFFLCWCLISPRFGKSALWKGYEELILWFFCFVQGNLTLWKFSFFFLSLCW